MIGKLTGIVDTISAETVIIDVAGVGYLLQCPRKLLQEIQPGQRCTFHVETYVREDIIKLFGFENIQEKEMFLLLQSVSGVGAKVALNIISSLSLQDISTAICSADKRLLSSVSGVGSKIAERILLELKGKKELFTQINISRTENSTVFHDAVAALEALGIGRSEAWSAVEKSLHIQPDAKVDDIIRRALNFKND